MSSSVSVLASIVLEHRFTSGGETFSVCEPPLLEQECAPGYFLLACSVTEEGRMTWL